MFLNRSVRRNFPRRRIDSLVPPRLLIFSLADSEYMPILIESALGNSYVNFRYRLGFKAGCRFYFENFGTTIEIEVNVVSIHDMEKSSNSSERI